MKKILFSVIVATLVASNLSADIIKKDSENISLGVDVGTSGIGLTVVKQMDSYPNWALRAGVHKYSINYTTTDNKADYDFDLNLLDVQLMADYHPWMGSFKITLGALYNGTDLRGTISPRGNTFIFNDITYSTSQVGSVKTSVDFDNPVAPYIGIGWDTSFNKPNNTWGFTFNLGVAYSGSAKVTYTPTFDSSVPDTTKQEIINNLEVEKRSLQNDLDKYEYLPFISIGFNYKF